MVSFTYHTLRRFIILYSWFHEREKRRHYGKNGYPVWMITVNVEGGDVLNDILRRMERYIYKRQFCPSYNDNSLSVPKMWYIKMVMKG